ncbi:MAG: hypothetical protein IKQ37_07645 [Bacteroidaceae bacterium]|nr:hypothetical protein [Bacteroidaceae bacterium]
MYLLPQKRVLIAISTGTFWDTWQHPENQELSALRLGGVFADRHFLLYMSVNLAAKIAKKAESEHILHHFSYLIGLCGKKNLVFFGHK